MSDWENHLASLAPASSFWKPRLILVKDTPRGIGIRRVVAWFAKRFGAFNLFNFIVVGRDFYSTCPAKYKRAVIAHEMGHYRGCHTLVLVIFTSLFISRDAIAQGIFHRVLSKGTIDGVLFVLIAVAVFIQIKRVQEHRADDYCMSVVGSENAIEALEWCKKTTNPRGKAPWVRQRINRLIGKSKNTGG